jgi:23S rRNA-/tRNA-specific pseudouridylate synthase
MTGRTHQIRAQLSESGFPILGDKLYGSNLDWFDNKIALKSCSIAFTYQTQRHIFELPELFELEN